MNKRKAITVLAIVAMILPMLEGLFSLSSFWRDTAYAETNVETLIARNDIEVNYTYMEDETNSELVHWLITYKHDVAARQSDEVSASLRFKLASPLADGQHVDLSGSTFNAPVVGDLWYRQSEFTPQSQGTIKITSPKAIPVTLAFQMDTMSLVEEIVTEEVEKEVTVQVEEEIPAGESQQDPVTEENTEVAEGEGTPVVALAASTPQTRLVDKTEIVTETVETVVESEQLNVDVLEADLAVDHQLDYSDHEPEEITAVEPEEEIVDEGEPVAENEEPVAEVDNAEGDVTVPEADETVVAEEETVAEGEVGEESVDELEEAEGQEKDENEAKDKEDKNTASTVFRATRNADPNPFNIQTQKRARLATKDADGEALLPLEAWEQRLYEIELGVSGESILGKLSGDIIMYVDNSGSKNGGVREDLVVKEIVNFAKQIRTELGEEATDNIRIAFLPSEKKDNSILPVDAFKTFYSVSDLVSEKNQATQLLNARVAAAMTKISGNKNLSGPLKFAKDNGMLASNPIGIAIGGTDYNEKGDTSGHSEFLAALLDSSAGYSAWQGVVSSPEYFFSGSGIEGTELGNAIQLALEKIRELLKAEGLSVQDTVTDYFDILTKSNAEKGISITGNKVVFSDQEMIDIPNSNRYGWTQTILVQAKSDFAGGNVIPTNIVNESFALVDGDEFSFEIYGEGNEPYDLSTPYVNVRMIPGVASSEEIILLGETAKTETKIKTKWSENHNLGYLTTLNSYDTVKYYGVKPEITMGSLSPVYNHQPITTMDGKNYQSVGEITAGFAENENSVAHTYADGYGTVGTNVPNADENTAVFVGEHKLTVRDTNFNFKKILDNLALPEGFSADFIIDRQVDEDDENWFAINPPTPTLPQEDSEKPENSITLNNSKQVGTFTGLGIGTYTLTEAMTLQGVKTPNPINILITRASSSTEANPIFSIVVGTTEYVVDGEVGVLEINNETKDIILDLLKKDSNTEKVIGGVKFKLTNNADDPRTNLLGVDNATDDTGKLSIPSGILKAGNTYTLVETTPKDGFIASPTEYEIAIDALGNISVTTNNVTYQHQTVDYESGSTIKVDLTIFNTRKGVLPATGGQGIQGYMMIALMLTVLTGGLFLVYVSRKRKGGM